jgi:hypothetical protein
LELILLARMATLKRSLQSLTSNRGGYFDETRVKSLIKF